MATGAGDEYWRAESAQGVFKHAILRRYLPVFAGKTGSTGRPVVLLDGYAGRGRHEDGTPGSAELILKAAKSQQPSGIAWHCYFFETDALSFESLTKVVEEYKLSGVMAAAQRRDVNEEIDDVIVAAQGSPLFLLLDPTGLGLTFNRIIDILSKRDASLPTEMLLNFSMDAVRRIGGHVRSPNRNDATLRRMDEAVGGDWWRAHFASESEPGRVVHGFVQRFNEASGMGVWAIPVKRKPQNEPLYYLVFATRNNHGLFAMSDSVARAAEDWRRRVTESEGSLFSGDKELAELEREALPTIKANLEALMQRHSSYKVVDHAPEILGDQLGQVRETVVRQAIKELYAEGRTSSTGTGKKIAHLMVRRPG